MEISYNLKYQKSTFANKVILDKEGEIIIYTKGFRLKGKGGNDRGELINFSEIKEFYYRDEKIFFITFNKEKYVLADAGTLFDQLVQDIYKSRNEFLLDALFMRGGKLKGEYEGHFDRISKFGRPINKGHAKFRLYEDTLVVIPTQQDAFALHFNFFNFHEFDDMEYNLKIVMEDGVTVLMSQLGNDFEFFQEKMDATLGGMYQNVVNNVLREVFPQFNAATLLKLAYKMKAGKAVSKYDIKKMDKEMAVEVEKFIYQDPVLVEKVSILTEMCDEENIFFGVAQDTAVKGGFIRWLMFVVPEDNALGFSILPRWQEGKDAKNTDDHMMFFYKIIMEKGNPADKLEDKVLEVNQALVNLSFAKDPTYKDKRELKHSPYLYAIRKLPYLRILRKSYVGKANGTDVTAWQAQVQDLLAKCKMVG